MHTEKDQKTKSNDTAEDKQIATSTEGCLLFITQIYYITTIFRLKLKKL